MVTVVLPCAASAQATPQDPGAEFRHDRHVAIACTDCHVSGPDHGALLVRGTADCRSCHHTPARSDRACAYCHGAAEMSDLVVPQSRRLSLSVLAEPVERSLDFSHVDHEARDCADCHRGGPTLEPVSLDCGRCHEEHHRVTNDGCWRCHSPPPDSAHTPEVHDSCAGSGCHVDPPLESPPRSRVGCLWCHEAQREHETQGVCEDCHSVRSGPAGTQPRRPPPVAHVPGDSPHDVAESPPSWRAPTAGTLRSFDRTRSEAADHADL